MKHGERLLPYSLVFLSLLVGGIFAYTATMRTLTSLESVLLQLFTWVAGLMGSFLIGRRSVTEAAREIIKPHARSAFRRLLSLYSSLSRAGIVIRNSQELDGADDHRIALGKLEMIVIEQLATADDALDDWHDIVPEDVAELRKKLSPEGR